MMEMARERSVGRNKLTEHDRRLHFRLSTEDLLNSTAMMPREARIQLLISQFGLDEDAATQLIEDLEKDAEALPLTLLQQAELSNGGQFIISKMGPNYEMSLLIAQATGSVIITDSSSRWQELLSAQHRTQGISSYPWHDAHSQFKVLPIDELFLDKFQKSQGLFAVFRNWLQTADKFVLDNNRSPINVSEIAGQASNLRNRLEQVSKELQLAHLQILSPDGGFSDANVQRLLARSSCLRYDKFVRSIYGIGF
jgi:hypothetical protein